jgi:hypothetical protein
MEWSVSREFAFDTDHRHPKEQLGTLCGLEQNRSYRLRCSSTQACQRTRVVEVGYGMDSLTYYLLPTTQQVRVLGLRE